MWGYGRGFLLADVEGRGSSSGVCVCVKTWRCNLHPLCEGRLQHTWPWQQVLLKLKQQQKRKKHPARTPSITRCSCDSTSCLSLSLSSCSNSVQCVGFQRLNIDLQQGEEEGRGASHLAQVQTVSEWNQSERQGLGAAASAGVMPVSRPVQ